MDDPVKSRAASRETMGGLAKGLAVLRAFSRETPTMTLSQLAERTGLAPATARRCLRTFEALGYPQHKVRLLLNRFDRRWDLIYMGILREEWQESAQGGLQPANGALERIPEG